MSSSAKRVEDLVASGHTSWIQELSKDVLLRICDRYKLAASEADSIDDIRRILRNFVKSQGSIATGPLPSPIATRNVSPFPSPKVSENLSGRPGIEPASNMTDYLTLKEVRQMIEVFDGSIPRKVDDLLQTAEYAISKVSPAQKPDVLELITKTKIQGEAAMELRYKTIRSFEELKEELLILYGSKSSTPAMLVELFSSKQGSNEAVHEYGRRVTQLMMDLIRACGARTEVVSERKGIEDLLRYQTLAIFENGLKNNLRTLVKSSHFNNLAASIRGAEEEEKVQNGASSINRRTNYTGDRTTTGIKCLRCNRTGHIARECTQTFKKNLQGKPSQNRSINHIELFRNFCERKGHLYKDCRDRMRRDERRAKNNDDAQKSNQKNSDGAQQNRNSAPQHANTTSRTAGSYKSVSMANSGRTSRNRIQLTAEGTTREKLTLLVDSGADISIIKLGMLADDLPVIEETTSITGIGQGAIKALCKVTLTIPLKNRTIEHTFIVVKDDFSLDADGILGIDFIEDHGAALGKGAHALFVYGERLEIMRQPKTSKVSLEPRTVTMVSVRTNSEHVGIVGRKELAEKVYLGNCVTSPANQECIVEIMNLNNHEVILDTPTVELEEITEIDYDSETDEEAYIGLLAKEMGSQRNRLLLDQIETNHLNREEKQSLLQICEKYSQMFYLPGDKLGTTNAASHNITLKDEGKPINVRPYRLPETQKQEVNKQVESMLANGVIRSSRSQWNAPLLVVPKKPDASGNRKFRIVVDYRKLNEITVGDSYPLPNITEILDQLGKAKYFTTLDLASGFHQIPMAEEDKEKTAFSTTHGHYEYNSMPFGLKNAPATFQRLMNTVLAGLQAVKCYVYLDDIVIHGATLKEHNDRLVEVLERLRESNLTLQPEKCQFLRKETSYLGHIITADGILPDPSKIEDVKKFKSPINVKQVQSFLGLAGYYRRFIQDFSHIARPLTQLTKKGIKFFWTQDEENAFQMLKTKLTSAPILQYPDFTAPFLITTDASDKAIGAVLSQGQIGKDLPIAYASRTLNKAERNYSTTEREMLAIVFGTKQFRPYVYGTHFTVVTDHLPLKWIFKIEDPGSRLLRMRIKLAEYEYDVVYKPGKQNTNADALSRIYKIYTSFQELEGETTEDEAKEDEAADDEAEAVELSTEAVEGYEETEPEYSEEEKKKILYEYHDAPMGGHQGVSRTLNRIRLNYKWPQMRRDIENYIDKCRKCQVNKTQKTSKAPMVVTDTPTQAFEKCALDIVGKLPETPSGKNYILTFQDVLTKFSKAMPLDNQEAQTVAREFVKNIICEYGTPKIILTDQGTNFVSELFKNICKLLKIQKIQTTAYHPESNGALERSHRTLAEYLKSYIDEDQRNWDEWLPYAMFTYNTTPHTSTGFTPFELIFGHTAEIPSAIKKAPRLTYAYDDYAQELRERLRTAHQVARNNLNAAKEKAKTYYDKKTEMIIFEPGDKVLLRDETVRRGRSKKLTPKYIGPYIILERNSEVNYTIKKGRGAVKVHVNRLKPFVDH